MRASRSSRSCCVRVLTVACVPTTSGTEVAANIEAASALVSDAASDGADFVLLPETVNIMDPRNKRMFEKIAPEGGDECLKAFRALAQETSIWLLAGSLVVKDSAPPPEGERAKAVNRSFLIDPEGGITARYDKIHMFDVDLGDGETYRESKTYEPGTKAVGADLPWGRLGMTVSAVLISSGGSGCPGPERATRLPARRSCRPGLRERGRRPPRRRLRRRRRCSREARRRWPVLPGRTR